MKYKLELTEDQARILSEACELYYRTGLGQFNHMVEFCMDREFYNRDKKMSDEEFNNWIDCRDKAEDLVYAARKYIYPELQGRGHSYGIGHNMDDNTAWNIHQVLRYYAGNDERKPFAVYGELPKIEKVEE